MPDIVQSLEGHDLGFLIILSNLWDIEPPVSDTIAEKTEIAHQVTDLSKFQTQYASLPDEAHDALHELQKHHGRLNWNLFTRKYGEVRDFGPAWRDREQPYLNPVSTAEYLWYRGLVARAFLKQGPVPQEFAYVPDDLLPLIPPPTRRHNRPIRVQSTTNREQIEPPYTTRLLDDLCTALSALRCGLPPYQNAHLLIRPPYSAFLAEILRSMELVSHDGILQPEKTRQLLEAAREQAFLEVFQNWRESRDIYELALVPALRMEGNWSYDAMAARSAALNMVIDLHREDWISLQEFCAEVKEHNPDFLRPDGNYDTWFVRTRSTGEYLQGFEHWDEVEGAYLRFLLLGPLFWMNVVETHRDETPGSQIFFRLTELGQDLLHGATPPAFPGDLGKIGFLKTTMLAVPAATPRWVRYMIARMSEWVGRQIDVYIYRITPESLAVARKQGLYPSHLIKLLQRFSATPIRPTLTRALERWEDTGTEAVIETVEVLRVSSPTVLSKLKETSAARFLGDPLGPTAVTIKPGARDSILRSLADIGYLAEIKREYNDSIAPSNSRESEKSSYQGDYEHKTAMDSGRTD
jgi:hypothetical protein